MSDLIESFKRSVAEFDKRVQQVAPDQWTNDTPCSDWNVRALVNHLVYEDRWVPDMLAERTVQEVGDRYDGDLLGDDPIKAWNEASREAVASVSEEGVLQRTVHASFGDITADEYLRQVLNDHVVHAWDLARGIGADDRLDPELVDVCYEYAKPIEDSLKSSGAYGDKVEAPPDADTQTKLLAVMGRRG